MGTGHLTTRFPSWEVSPEPLSVLDHFLSGTLKGLRGTSPPLPQRTRIITWFLNDCAEFTLTFLKKWKKRTIIDVFKVTGLKECPPFAGNWQLTNSTTKTPGDEKRDGERGHGTKVDIDLSFMQINAVWLTHWQPGCVGARTSVLPEVISIFVYSPLVHARPFNWIACAATLKIYLLFNDPKHLPGGFSA